MKTVLIIISSLLMCASCSEKEPTPTTGEDDTFYYGVDGTVIEAGRCDLHLLIKLELPSDTMLRTELNSSNWYRLNATYWRQRPIGVKVHFDKIRKDRFYRIPVVAKTESANIIEY